MKSLVRLALAGMAILATFFVASWFPFSFFLPHGHNEIRFIGCLLCAVLVAWWIWVRTASISDGMAGSMILGAVIIGAAGFSVGFFGPMVFDPGANQGPLLGIFITGPLGSIAGAVAGRLLAGTREAGRLSRANCPSATSRLE